MREKLIEFLEKFWCGLDQVDDECRGNCNYCLANYLIDNGITVLPCKIGDTVWAVRYYGKTPVIKQCVVSEMAYLEDMRLAIAVKADRKYSVRGFWGVNIFATREECKAALGGKDNDTTTDKAESV